MLLKSDIIRYFMNSYLISYDLSLRGVIKFSLQACMMYSIDDMPCISETESISFLMDSDIVILICACFRLLAIYVI